MQTRPVIVDPDLQRVFYGSFAHEFRRSVNAYLKRWRVPPSTFGLEALGDSAFVGRRLRKGRAVQLATADRVLAYMGMRTFRPMLVCELDAFLRIARLKPWQLGEWALGQPRFVSRLVRGASPYLPTIDRLRGWMHLQLRPGELDAVLLAVAGDLAANAPHGRETIFFLRIGIRMDGRSVNEGSFRTVDDAGGGRAAVPEPAHAGALSRRRQGAAVPQDRALGALHARGSRALAGRAREVFDRRRRRRLGRSAALNGRDAPGAGTHATAAALTAVAARLALTVAPAALWLLTGMEAAATTDTTFAAPLTTVTDMVGGTGGQLAAVLAVGAALVGSVLRFNATQIMGAVGVGVAAGAGAGVVTSIVGTAIV